MVSADESAEPQEVRMKEKIRMMMRMRFIGTNYTASDLPKADSGLRYICLREWSTPTLSLSLSDKITP